MIEFQMFLLLFLKKISSLINELLVDIFFAKR